MFASDQMSDHGQRHCPRFSGPFAKYRAYAQLLTRRGPHAYKRNELNASKIRSLGERLDYEAVIQYTGLKDNDLLYFSYANQARMIVRARGAGLWECQEIWGFSCSWTGLTSLGSDLGYRLCRR